MERFCGKGVEKWVVKGWKRIAHLQACARQAHRIYIITALGLLVDCLFCRLPPTRETWLKETQLKLRLP